MVAINAYALITGRYLFDFLTRSPSWTQIDHRDTEQILYNVGFLLFKRSVKGVLDNIEN
jgi:hypothetical protein